METIESLTEEQLKVKTEEEEAKAAAAQKARDEERKNRPYKLFAGGAYRYEVAPYDGQHFEEQCNGMSGFDVYTKDIEAIKSACELLGLKFFKIEDDYKTIFESNPVIAQENKRKAESDTTAAEMQAKADAFNALPDTIHQWTLPEGATVSIIKNSPAEYKRSWSNTTMYRGSVHIVLKLGEKSTDLYPSTWIKSNGSIQKKKLKNIFAAWPVSVVDALIEGIQSYQDKEREVNLKYRVS